MGPPPSHQGVYESPLSFLSVLRSDRALCPPGTDDGLSPPRALSSGGYSRRGSPDLGYLYKTADACFKLARRGTVRTADDRPRRSRVRSLLFVWRAVRARRNRIGSDRYLQTRTSRVPHSPRGGPATATADTAALSPAIHHGVHTIRLQKMVLFNFTRPQPAMRRVSLPPRPPDPASARRLAGPGRRADVSSRPSDAPRVYGGA